MKLNLKNHIQSNPIVAYENETIEVILDKMGELNHIPVLSETNIYKGVISKINIYETLLEGKKCNEIVAKELVMENEVIYEKSTLNYLIERLKNTKYLFLPLVSEDNHFIGIIPNRKVLEVFENSIGSDKEGHTIEILSYDFVGVVNSITNILKREGINLVSINIVDPDIMNLRKIYIKVDLLEQTRIEDLINKLKREGFDIR